MADNSSTNTKLIDKLGDAVKPPMEKTPGKKAPSGQEELTALHQDLINEGLKSLGIKIPAKFTLV